MIDDTIDVTAPPKQRAWEKNLTDGVTSSLSGSGMHFKIFSCLWAIATLFHMAQSSLFDTQLHFALLTLSAIYVILRPGSVFGFVVLLLLQLQDIYYKMPGVTNHWIFTGFVTLTILLALLLVVLKNKSFKINTQEWLDTFAPAVRVELLILYFYVVFHKLNSGFFNTQVSCVTDFMNAQNTGGLIPLTSGLLTAAIYLTLIIETLIPVLLWFKSTRHWGILVGLLFHCLLAFNPLNGFYDFSSMLYAVYALFFSAQLVNNFAHLWSRFREKDFFAGLRAGAFSYTKLFLIVALLGIGFMTVNVLTKKLPNFHLHFFWLGFSVLFIVGFLWALALRAPAVVPAPKPFFSMPHWSLALLPLAVFLNGLSPYLGLKTENSFAMFSNLRTEAGISNHYLVPASIQIFDYQKDMVEIVSSSDKELQRLAAANKIMPYFKFKDHVAGNQTDQVTYIRNGQQHTFCRAEAQAGDPLLSQNPLIFRKVLNFREISKNDPQPCAH